MLNVDGVVVLYNPTFEVLDNIESYSGSLRTLYVVDNSTELYPAFIEEIERISNAVYLRLEGNQGIAKALNLGAQQALSNGANWLLTMDQDSSFSNDAAADLIKQLTTLEGKSLVGVFSPKHDVPGLSYSGVMHQQGVIEQMTVMTSGNLLNLELHEKLGGFLERYFIDCVDHEYCLRLRKNGYKVLMSDAVLLDHNLGDLSVFSFFGRKVYFTNHGYVRRYYMTRNRLDLFFRYVGFEPRFVFNDLRNMLFEFLKLILFEEDKARKIKAIFKGLVHFSIGRFGKWS